MWIKVSCLEAAMLEEAQTTEQVPQSVPTAQVPGDSQHQPPDTYTRCLQPAEVTCPSLRIFSDELYCREVIWNREIKAIYKPKNEPQEF